MVGVALVGSQALDKSVEISKTESESCSPHVDMFAEQAAIKVSVDRISDVIMSLANKSVQVINGAHQRNISAGAAAVSHHFVNDILQFTTFSLQFRSAT